MSINRDYSELLGSFQSDKFQQLRDAQQFVLTDYSTKRLSSSDVAIELPTGAGKTLIALLITEAWRQEGKKRQFYRPTRLSLVNVGGSKSTRIPAVLMEGRALTFQVVTREVPTRRKRGGDELLGVFNQNPVIDPADIIVMDDAHLAEHCLHSLYSVEIKRHDHENLFEALITELQARFRNTRF